MNQIHTVPWHVLRVRTQFERVIATRLSRMGITALAPAQKQLRQGNGRTHRREVILFPGYVFVSADSEQRSHVFRAGSQIISYLSIEGKPAVLKEREVKLIRSLAELDNPVTVLHQQFSPGDQVEITAGPLRGYNGVVAQQSGKKRILLQIPGLQCMAQVEVRGHELRKL